MAAPRGIQNIPIRIPEKWDRVWFEGFIRDVLAFADVRNAIPGAGVLIDGSSSGNATISADADVSDLFDVGYILADPSGLLPNSRGLVGEPGVVQILDPGPGTDVSVNLVAHGVALSKLQTLGQFSVVGNPGGVSGNATEISAASDGMMLVRQSGQLQFVPISQGGASAAGLALMYECDSEPGERGPPGPKGSSGGGGGGSSPLTTKGDVWGFDTADNRIPVGADGTVLTADSASALGVKYAVPAGGGGAGASFSGVRLTRSTTQAMTGGADVMSWDTEAYDTASYHDNVTNPTRITIPTTGKYHVVCSIAFSASGFSAIQVRLNGGANIAINGLAASLGAGQRFQLPFDYAFTAGDYIEMLVTDTGGGTTINTDGATFFACHQLAGVSGSGAVVFVGNATVTGANATSLTISGLDLDTDGEYLIRFNALNANAAQQDVSLYFNADVTATNYDSQIGVADNAFVGAARANNAVIGSITGGASTAVGDWEIKIRRGVDGRVRAHWRVVRGGGPTIALSQEYGAHCWRTASTNVTALTFTIAVASGLVIGSFVKVWKIVG